MRYTEVFVPGGYPQYTYNPRATRNLESRLKEVADNLCKLATVTGYTKSGKTVLVRKAFPPEETVWVDGGVISQEEDIWSIVIDRLALFQGYESSTTTAKSRELSADVSGETNFLLAKASGAVGGKLGTYRDESITSSQQLNSRVAAISGLRKAGIPLVIDDFHYIPRELQGSVVRALKAAIFDGLAVVLIAIPHRRYDALKVEKEMTGRLHPLSIPLWEDDELAFIPLQGFRLLNSSLSDEAVQIFTNEAIGSPHLMQDFCRTLCRHAGVETDASGQGLAPSAEEIEGVFQEVAETIGRPIFEKLARGPRQRTDRRGRKLKDGQEVDIYGLLLRALANIKPGLVTLEYEDLRAAIKDVAIDAPQLHEVARVLKHMATIAASDQSSTPVIDFEEEEKTLHITDPFFAFYLRWGSLDA